MPALRGRMRMSGHPGDVADLGPRSGQQGELHLDEQLRANRADRFLTDGGPGQQWSDSAKTPAELRELIRQLCSAADEAMNTG